VEIVSRKHGSDPDTYWKKNIRKSDSNEKKRKLDAFQEVFSDEGKVLKKAKTNKKSMMFSGLNEDDRDVLYSCVQKIGGLSVETNKEFPFSHLIVEGDKRTVKVLYALARRAWILDAAYLYSSFEFGDWVAEKDFESKAYPEKKLRDAYGPLFNNYNFFFNSADYENITVEELTHIVTLGGGKATDDIKLSNVIVSNGKNAKEREETSGVVGLNDPPYLISFKWILDSLTKYRMMNFKDYAI